jgi:hypothetical protein
MTDVSPARAQQTTRNVALVGRFIDEILANDDVLAGVPKDASLVLVPVDDSSLARANFEIALRIANRGENVRLQLVGRPPIDSPVWQPNDLSGFDLQEIRPHFPTEPPVSTDVTIVYDQEHDALLVDFYGGRRQGIGVPVNEYVAIRIDPESHELIGYLVASFLQVGAVQSPILASALRKAHFRTITDVELGGLQIAGESSESLSDHETMAVVTEITRLIA